MNFARRFKSNTTTSQIVFAFITLTAVIIALDFVGYGWTRQMLRINALKELAAQIKEHQLRLKSASNEFILRERCHEDFFATGKSPFLDRYFEQLELLRRDIAEFRHQCAALHVGDEKEIQTLGNTLEHYHKVFAHTEEKIKTRGYGRYGIIGRFDTYIKELLQYDFGNDRIVVLSLELFVKNYLLTGDEKLSRNISDEIFRFTMVLENHIQDAEVAKVSQILYNYEQIFKDLVTVDRELGIYSGKGLQELLFLSTDRLDEALRLPNINKSITEKYAHTLSQLYAVFFLMVGAALLAAFITHRRLYKTLAIPVTKMKSIIASMSRGEVPQLRVNFKMHDLNEMAHAVNNLVNGSLTYQRFANNIGKGNLDVTFTPLSEHDILGQSLLAMRDSLKANISEQRRQMLELQKVNAELDSFTYHASHDLRAPLSSIQGLVHLGLHEQTPQQMHLYFEMIQNRVNHMAALLKDLIAIYHNNKTDTNFALFDFDAEVKAILESLETPGHPFEIQLDIRQPAPFASDAVRVRTILSNLLSNAFKYFNPDVARHSILVSITVDAHHAFVAVKDNGVGIDDDYKDKIFNMFFRATTRSTGTGLGLYIVRSIVERLGGDISFDSRVNHGTTFLVQLPNDFRKLQTADIDGTRSEMKVLS